MFLMTRQAIPRTWRTLRKGVTGIPLNAPITWTTEDGTTPKPGVPVSCFLIAMFLLIIGVFLLIIGVFLLIIGVFHFDECSF